MIATVSLALLAAVFVFDDRTGAIGAVSARDGRKVATGFRNVYHVLSGTGDRTADERCDAVVTKGDAGRIREYVCTNAVLDGLEIRKRYEIAEHGVRRITSFRHSRAGTSFIRFETEGHLDPDFMRKAWFLGSGYIGPYKPYPHKDRPQPMNWYVQSSKGIVFTNPENEAGSFAQWRVRIDGTTVLPWWHSTISSYREKDDRFWFLPDGYRLCLGTFGLPKDTPVVIEDRFDRFDGGPFEFMDGIFARDRHVAAEFAAIPRPPDWIGDLLAVVQSGSLDYYRYLVEMEPDAPLLGSQTTFGNWCDYRPVGDGTWVGSYGGTIRTDEVREYLGRLRALSPRIRHHFYNLVISAGERTRVVAEHPDWFRAHDRGGKPDSLFPGDQNNWQTMFCCPEARRYVVDMSSAFADMWGSEAIYNDEAQMTNSIDWDRGRVTRDDDVVKYWRALRRRATADGRILFFNGSGIPYADLNCMESPHELAPNRWRDWVGVAWGIGMINRMRPGNRTVLLYWRKGLDYVNRVLALGWLPYPAQGVSLYPIDVMRAVRQSGNLLPIDARYSPDWKRDRHTQVESHAVRREDGRDVLVSFINRAAATNDIPVSVDLGSLGFADGERLNVWEMTPREDPARGVRYFLSDAEIRANWRKGINAGGTFLDSHLVWSGPARGAYAHVLKAVGTDRMRQLLFVPGPAAFYAIGERPCDYHYATDRRARITGRRVSAKVPTDVMLAGKGLVYDRVTVNGKPAETRAISVGGDEVTLVKVPAGDSELSWREGRRDAARPLPPDPLRLSGPPSKVRWSGDERMPARLTVEPVGERRGGLTISKRAESTTKWRDFCGLQKGLHPGVAVADAKNLTLEVGSSRREGGFDYLDLHNWAGFELTGAKSLPLVLSHTFGTVNSVATGHTNRHWPGQDLNFVGLAVDYRVGGRYAKRVYFRMDGREGPIGLAEPSWGKADSAADEIVSLGNPLEGPERREFDLELAAHAPSGWDGTVFFSAGATRLWPNRRISIAIRLK